MKKKSIYSLLTYVLAFIGLAALIALPIMSANNYRLSQKISELEGKISAAEDTVASYGRILCSNNFANFEANKTNKYTLNIDGIDRTYYVHTPKDYDASVRYPVIMNFDGISGSGLGMQHYSGVNKLPVISVYPDPLVGKGGFTAWQGAPYSLDGDGDVKFVKAVLDNLPANYCVDSTKIFGVGMSNGGGFAMILGCELSQYFRAVVGVSGAYYTECTSKGREASVMAIHSATDAAVPFYGSLERGLPPVTEWAKTQAKERSCKSRALKPSTGSIEQTTWYDCRDDSLVRLVVVGSGSHGWFLLPEGMTSMNYRDPSMAAYVWAFLEESTYAGGSWGELY